MRRGREYNGREKRRESEGIGKEWRAGRKGGEAHNCEASNALGRLEKEVFRLRENLTKDIKRAYGISKSGSEFQIFGPATGRRDGQTSKAGSGVYFPPKLVESHSSHSMSSLLFHFLPFSHLPSPSRPKNLAV